MHHFIGKDIINFHALFWPAVLDGANFRKPTRIHTHGFITVDGTKMSKSRGTSIDASRYLEFLEPEYLRYYYATKLNGTIDDIDINLDDFVQRVNSDLVGKIVNIASRCAGFINKQFDGALAPGCTTSRCGSGSSSHPISWRTGTKRVTPARPCARSARWRIWPTSTLPNTRPGTSSSRTISGTRCSCVCSQGINLFRSLIVYLKPILPKTAADAESFLAVEPLTWADAATPLLSHRINLISR